MSFITQKSIPTSPSTTVLARIEAQDEVYVQPLREFLHEAGCDVEVNLGGQGACTYWICAGDAEYMKSIIAQGVPLAQKHLCILYDGQIDKDEESAHSMKIALVDPVPLDTQTTRQLFAFFFTSRVLTYNDRKGLSSTKTTSVIPKQAAREPRMAPRDSTIEDVSRIAHIMKQIFIPKSNGTHKKKQDRATLKFFKVMIWIFVTVVAPVILYGMAFVMSFILLFLSGKSLIAGNTAWAGHLLEYGQGYTQSASMILDAGAIIFPYIGLARFAQDQESILGIMRDAAKSEAGVLRIVTETNRLAVHALDPSASDVNTMGLSDVISLRSDVTTVAQHLALVQAKLDALLASSRFPFSLPYAQTVGHRSYETVVRMRRMLELTLRLLTLYAEIGGFKKAQTYLVLLQNSMEIRPTGGFIGSVLLVTFADGALTDMKVHDVYVADGQLKGHVDPPAPIRDMLAQEHWYLRDSNWDPDFSKSAAQAAWFYEKEMGVSVDGVVGVSLPMLTRLLEVTGPLELPDFNERISASNFFVKSLLYTQANFFPGSTQKEDFLGNLANALVLRLTTDHTIQIEKILLAIGVSLEAKDIQFYFPDQELEHVVTQWSWAGGIGFAPCAPIYRYSPCVADGVGIVQANLGVNKVNYFMKQEALSQITIQNDGTITHDLTVTMKNTSNNQGQDGGGTYQAYLRFLYPEGTDLVHVTIDGQPATPSSSVVAEQAGRVFSVGVPMYVPPKSEHQINLSTKWSVLANFTPAGTYVFSIRKQPGVEIFPWHVIVNYPEGWRATADVDLAKPGSLQYNTDLLRDALLKVLFETAL